jgi:hypothetical protein
MGAASGGVGGAAPGAERRDPGEARCEVWDLMDAQLEYAGREN